MEIDLKRSALAAALTVVNALSLWSMTAIESRRGERLQHFARMLEVIVYLVLDNNWRRSSTWCQDIRTIYKDFFFFFLRWFTLFLIQAVWIERKKKKNIRLQNDRWQILQPGYKIQISLVHGKRFCRLSQQGLWGNHLWQFLQWEETEMKKVTHTVHLFHLSSFMCFLWWIRLEAFWQIHAERLSKLYFGVSVLFPAYCARDGF